MSVANAVNPIRKSDTELRTDARALVRLQSDHVNRSLVPAFYRYLQAQDEEKQIEGGKEFHGAIEGLVTLLERAEREITGGGGASGEGEQRALRKGLGLWVAGGDLGWTDIMAGPCTLDYLDTTINEKLMTSTIGLFRATNVLKHYRGFELPAGKKFEAWLERLFNHPAFKSTCSTEELYLESYER